MPHICAYIRQSDEEGHKKELSCPSQEKRFLEDLQRRRECGEDITHEVAPWDEGHSGGEMDRPGLQWLLANLDRLQEVWVYDHDRLVRHDFYAPLIMREFRTRGVKLWCSTGGADEETPMGRFMTDLRFRFGALYREQIAERTKMNRDHRLREGLWSGPAPAGYKFVNENGEGSRRILVPDPETAPQVKALLGMMADGVSQKKACERLGTYPSKVVWQRDNPLYIGLVYKHRQNVSLLTDRSYRALWTLAEDPECDWLYPGRQEPIVDAGVWDKLQRRLATSPRARMSERRALSGRLRCQTCGSVLRIRPNQGRRHPSLQCEKCRWERSYRYAENTAIAALALLTSSPEFEEALEAELRARSKAKESKEHLARLERERAKVAKKLDRTIDALVDADELSPTLRAKAGELQRMVKELDDEIAALKASERGRSSAVKEWRRARKQLLDLDLWTIWREASVGEQRDVLMNTFTTITASPEQVTFGIRGLDLALELEWQKGDMSPFVEVAGPGLEPGTP